MRISPLLAVAAMSMAEFVPLLGDEAAANKHSLQVDRLFHKWDRPDSPGIAVGIVHNGKLIHSRGYGMANRNHDVPIDSTTVFEIASVTKSFTTAAIALLLDDGEVNLDDDIRKYIPELPKVDPPIKVRHLLRCESGFRDYYLSLQLAGWNVLDAWTKEDVLQLIAAQKRFDFSPGEQFAYSNSDFFLLALIARGWGIVNPSPSCIICKSPRNTIKRPRSVWRKIRRSTLPCPLASVRNGEKRKNRKSLLCKGLRILANR